MSRSIRILAPALLLTALVSARAEAQAAPPAERFITVSKFHLPQDTAQRRLVTMWVDSVMVPMARMDPNVLAYRIANHRWGANSNEVVMIAEYGSWATIEGECKPCDERFEAMRPKEGTPARQKWDAMQAAFNRAYQGHADEIYAYPVTRAKP